MENRVLKSTTIHSDRSTDHINPSHSPFYTSSIQGNKNNPKGRKGSGLKGLVVVLMMMLVCLGTASAKEKLLSRTYQQRPLPEVLIDMDRSTPNMRISFMYDKLEDYTITTSFQKRRPIEALYDIIGFYPLLIKNIGDTLVTIEPIRKSSTKVIGRLIGEEGLPVEFATVRLFSPVDSSFITGGVSNSNGDFVIPVSADKVILKVEHMTYYPYSAQVSTGRIGTIRLQTRPNALRDVVVKGDAVTIEDGLIIARPTKTQVAYSVDFLTLLSQLPFPGLFVDPHNQTVTVNNGTPMILIDGIERKAKDLLLLRPTDVKRIEFSINLPLKYISRSGNYTGYINVILKKKNEGGSVFAQGETAFTCGFVNGGVALAYNQGKSEFQVQYVNNYRNYRHRIVNSEQRYIGDDFEVSIESKGHDEPFGYMVQTIQGEYIYRHDNSLVMSARLTDEISNQHSDRLSDIWDNSNAWSRIYQRHSRTRDNGNSPVLDLYARKDWENMSLESQLSGQITTYDYDRLLRDSDSSYGPQSNPSYDVEYPSKRHSNHKSLWWQSVFTHQIDRRLSWGLNLDASLKHTRNDYILQDYKEHNNTDGLSLTGFIRLGFGKCSLGLSTGAKSTWLRNDQNSRWVISNISNMDLSWNISRTSMLSSFVSYSSSVPTLSLLTDFRQVYDGYLLISGNPNLKDEHYLSGGSIYTSRINRFTLSAGLKGLYRWNGWYTDVSYLGDQMFLSKPMNLKWYWHLQPLITLGVNEICNRHLSLKLSYAHYFISNKGNDFKHRFNAPYFFAQATGYMGKFSLSAAYKVPLKSLYAYTLTTEENYSNFSVSYSPLKNLFIQGAINYFIGHHGTYYPSENLSKVNPGWRKTLIKDNWNMVTLTLRYSADFGRIFNRINRTLQSGKTDADAKKVE